MSAIASLSATATIEEPKTEREAFERFVAGTFYRQMFKALRNLTSEPAYLSGGASEKMFRSYLDEEVIDSLSRTHGKPLVDSLWKAREQQQSVQPTSSVSPGGQSGEKSDS